MVGPPEARPQLAARRRTRPEAGAWRTSRAMPPSRGRVEAPPSVTSTPPCRTNSSRFPTPGPGQAAGDVGRGGGRAVARELRRLRVRERAVPRVDAVDDVLQAASVFGNRITSKRVAQAAASHVLVHDQRVGHLLVVEDHPHPARATACRSRSAAAPRRGRSSAWRGTSGATRPQTDVEAQLGRRLLQRRPQAGLGGDDPGARAG